MVNKSICVLALFLAITGCKRDEPGVKPATQPAAAAPKADDSVISLFDGKSLKNWKSSEFGGDGDCRAEDGRLVVSAGASLSGVTWTGPALPTMDYEVELDAMKVSGDDFFVGLTFPYGKSHASLILGGWGGSVCGISSINGDDAANNPFATSRNFKRGEWYHIKLKVTKSHITAWVSDDTEPLVDVPTEDKEISLRIDIESAKPFGLSTYQTTAHYKNIVIKKL